MAPVIKITAINKVRNYLIATFIQGQANNAAREIGVTTMNTKFRTTIAAFAFVATVAAVATGLTTFRGETKEASIATLCSTATWPSIPASCLEGGSGHAVRNVTTDRLDEVGSADVGQLAMQGRFDIAFQ